MSTDSLAMSIGHILEPYRTRFDRAFDSIVPTLGDDTKLLQACAYAVRSGGKRLRPAIVWMVAEALRSPVSVDLAALAVEFFHTSSLVADDLPCMDNDDFRRGLPTTHKVFSESVAIMASFGLTSAGFGFLTAIEVPKERREAVLRLAVIHASRAIGLRGIMGGQFLDLETQPRTMDDIFRVFDMKTGVLFNLCFIFGWIFGGGDLGAIDRVQNLAIHFGRAFQIMDDIDDLEQDAKAGKQLNYALQFGFQEACSAVIQNVDDFCVSARELGIGSSPIIALASGMKRVL